MSLTATLDAQAALLPTTPPTGPLRKLTPARVKRLALPCPAWGLDPDTGRYEVPMAILGLNDLGGRSVRVCYRNCANSYMDWECIRVDAGRVK